MPTKSQRPPSVAKQSILICLACIISLSANFAAAATETNTAENTQAFHQTPFIDTWNTPYEPFKDEGTFVESADTAGSYILGVPGMIISLPIGIGGALVTQLTQNDFDTGFDATVNTISSGFGVVGKYVLGLPAYALKSFFYNAPKSVLASESDGKKEKKHGSPKVRR